MLTIPRRRFLHQVATAGMPLAAGGRLVSLLRAQTGSSVARVVVDPARRVAEMDRRLLGSFLEHLGRATVLQFAL